MGYTMTAEEVTWWQGQAALLDPAAYDFIVGTGQTETVPSGETWYLVNGWKLDAVAGEWYHRSIDVGRAMPLSEGTSVTTHASEAASFMYLCKPSLVTGVDSRYSTDPRGLYFDRIAQLGTLPQFQIGLTETGTGTPTATFPGDFTNGCLVQVSVHDVAWLILLEAGESGGMNTLPEVSDTHQNRYAEACFVPFVRATFPKIMIRGVNESEGSGSAWYVKLPGGW